MEDSQRKGRTQLRRSAPASDLLSLFSEVTEHNEKMVLETREQKYNKFCCKVFSLVSQQISDQAHKHEEKLQLKMRLTLFGVHMRETGREISKCAKTALHTVTIRFASGTELFGNSQ